MPHPIYCIVGCLAILGTYLPGKEHVIFPNHKSYLATAWGIGIINIILSFLA